MSQKLRYILLSIGSSVLLVGFAFFVARSGGDLTKRLVDLSFKDDWLEAGMFLLMMLMQTALTLSLILREAREIRKNAAKLREEIARLIQSSIQGIHHVSTKNNSHSRSRPA